MARILLTWELGSGFGHVASLSSIAGGLRRQGHEVVAALREPQRGEPFFAPLGVRTHVIPSSTTAPHASTPIATYADLLASVGFGQMDSLQGMIAGWDRIFTEVNPDMVVFDHSPFALLAAIGWQFGKLQHGTGFYIPPDTSPLPVLRPWLLRNVGEALDREAAVLTAVNQVLKRRGQKSLGQLASLYSSCECWLATYEELDHFGQRGLDFQPAENSATGRLEAYPTYRGITPPPSGGLRPNWPQADGPRIFAYLQPDGTTLTTIEALAKLGYPTIARVSGLNATQSHATWQSMQLVSEAVDVEHVARECDLAILSGGHGTLAAVLLAGKPVVITPIQFEQFLLARRCEEAGIGIAVPPGQPRYFVDGISKMLTGNSHRDHAQAFAERYRSLNLHSKLYELINLIERLAVPA